jgi:hypothetical protein
MGIIFQGEEMRSIRLAAISILLVMVFVTAAFLPNATVLAQDTRGVAAPTPKSPHGTILDTTPTYKWTVVAGATIYRYQVWQGSMLKLDKSPDSGICGATLCEKSPAFTLGYNLYKWRVKAYKGGVWSAWSAYMTFTVSPPSFESNFSGSMPGWARKAGGTWSFSKNMYLFSEGLADNWTSAYRTSGQYSNFDYSARLWRDGDDDNYIVVRMGTIIDSSKSRWQPGYYFGYSNAGSYAVYYVNDAGIWTPLQAWTGSSAINKNGWNTLRVIASGDKFWYYINGTFVKLIIDNSRLRGFVGVAFYRTSGSITNNFFVDWATLTVKETVQ